MSKLESLITELKEELQELEDARGTRFPMIEEATDIQIAYITKELSDLEMLQEHEKHQLNENQQIVLDWLKAYTDSDNGNGDKPISAIWYMMYLITGNAIERRVRNAYFELTRKKEAEVLQAFAEWGLNHERD